ncbi:MAG: dockerin type I repeat-containing protein, partial [Phycisphaerales bacterium]
MLKAQHSAGGAALAVTMLIAFSHVAVCTGRAAAVPPERPDVPAGTTPNSVRTFHTFDIEEVFSDHDGSVQFIELCETAGADGHHHFAGNQLRSGTNLFTYPTDLPDAATAHRSVLIATAAFAALPGAVTPDYIIPERFFEVTGDTISIFEVQTNEMVDTFVFGGSCPCDGDVNEDGVVNIVDILDVYECATGLVPPSDPQCDLADVNCDGIVDTCDMSRVTCYFYGQMECCYDNSVCGACCSDGGTFRTCEVVSADSCASPLFWGTYKGDGTVCDPWPCDATECTTDADCNDENVCTEDACVEGTCVNENLPNGTACPDELFCNGDETCYLGACQSGPPRTCDDALACTVDTCNEAEDVCLHAPAGCNNDGVCDSPCEYADNCPADCTECPCVLDQDGDGLIKIQDVLNVVTCADGETPAPPLTCDQADLNCDGEVDFCDVSRVYCGFVNHPDCCRAEFICGACC